jgi:hypothetical protein
MIVEMKMEDTWEDPEIKEWRQLLSGREWTPSKRAEVIENSRPVIPNRTDMEENIILSREVTQ